MFQSISIGRQQIGAFQPPVDFGILAEAMLYYDTVHLVADYGLLKHLLSICGPEDFLQFMEDQRLKIIYMENMIGIQTTQRGGRHYYEPVLISGPINRPRGIQAEAPKIFGEVVGRAGRGRRLARRFIEMASTYTYEQAVTVKTLQDFSDSDFVYVSVNQAIKYLVPEYIQKEPIKFGVRINESSIEIDTNLNFTNLNSLYRSVWNPSSNEDYLSVAAMLLWIMDVNAALDFASFSNSDVILGPLQSSISRLKINEILKKSSQSSENIDAFQDYVLPNAKTIREVINSGERSIADLRSLLDEADKFRHWVRGKQPDDKLVSAYTN